MASTASQRVPEGIEDRSAAVWGGAGIALGSLGVVVTSAFYLASPQAAAMPHATLDLNLAIEGAVRGAGTMRLAGFFGVLGDVTIAAAALMIGIDQITRKRAATAFGWLLISICVVLFAIVDSMVGYVLSPVASQAWSGAQAGGGAFLAVKSLFDTLFLLGTTAFGAGATLALGADALGRARDVSRVLAVPAVIIGLAGAVAGIVCLAGADFHVLIGPSVVGNAVVFTLVGLQLARPKGR